MKIFFKFVPKNQLIRGLLTYYVMVTTGISNNQSSKGFTLVFKTNSKSHVFSFYTLNKCVTVSISYNYELVYRYMYHNFKKIKLEKLLHFF